MHNLNLKRTQRRFLFLYILSFPLSLIAQIPQISSFSPTTGPVGTTVTISGSNFNPAPTDNIVYFGAAKANVTTATSTSLTVNVPSGGTYQPITVITNNHSASSSRPFLITFSSSNGSFSTNSFSATTNISTGIRPHSIACGDFNNDGKVDLVTANYIDNTISVFKNTSSLGNISFTAKTDYACGRGAFGAAIGDLNGDGKLDIAIANYFAGTISLFKNISSDGNISFAPKVDFYCGEGPRIVVIGDLDIDGKADLAVANDDGRNISILRNTSTENFSFTQKTNYYPGHAPRDISIGDFDGDGKPDLAVANFGSNSIALYKNNSTAGFISFSFTSYSYTGSNPRSIAVGDLNNDNKPDIAVSNHSSGSISIFKNLSNTGNILFSSKTDVPCGENPYGISMDDLNGDGKLDVAVANLYASTVSLLKNISSEDDILFDSKVNLGTQFGTISISITDLDGDGIQDIAAANDSSSTVSYFKNKRDDKVLPLDLLSFEAEADDDNSTLLKWKTKNEINTSKFIIEHTIDKTSFNPIISIDGAGTSTATKEYAYRHSNTSIGNNYYRLKMTDTNGDYKYSQIKQVNHLKVKNENLLVYPNPVNKKFVTIKYAPHLYPTKIDLVDIVGKLAKTIQIGTNSFETSVDLHDITPGMYTLVLYDSTGMRTQKIIVE